WPCRHSLLRLSNFMTALKRNCHSRESGNPFLSWQDIKMGSRFRGNDRCNDFWNDQKCPSSVGRVDVVPVAFAVGALRQIRYDAIQGRSIRMGVVRATSSN